MFRQVVDIFVERLWRIDSREWNKIVGKVAFFDFHVYGFANIFQNIF